MKLGKPVYNRKREDNHKNYCKGDLRLLSSTISNSPKQIIASRFHVILEYTTN